MNRREFYENAFSAKALFAAGLAIMPSLVFNPNTGCRVIQFLFFCLLVLLSGRKINLIFTLLIIAFITAFNLIIPYGQVLFSFGFIKITSGALKAGIHRAVTLEALFMLSKVCVRRDLKLPGSFGELLGESFRIFSVLMNRKFRVTGKNIIAEIDKTLLELNEESEELPSHKPLTKPVGYIILVIIIMLSWALFFSPCSS